MSDQRRRPRTNGGRNAGEFERLKCRFPRRAEAKPAAKGTQPADRRQAGQRQTKQALDGLRLPACANEKDYAKVNGVILKIAADSAIHHADVQQGDNNNGCYATSPAGFEPQPGYVDDLQGEEAGGDRQTDQAAQQ